MSKLILFELKKIIYKKSFIVTLLLIIAISFIVVFLTNKKDYNVHYNPIKEEIAMNKTSFNKKFPETKYNNYKKQTNIKNKIIKENNLKYKYSQINKNKYLNKTKYIMEKSYVLLMFLALIIIITSGQIMSGEYHKKTINGLLLMPYKRYKVLLSKIITSILLLLIYSLLLIIMMFIFTLIIKGTSELLIPSLEVFGGKVTEVNYIFLFLSKYFTLLIPVLFITVFSCLLSSITKNSAISVSISIFLSVGSLIISSLLLGLNVPFVDFTFLPYLDYSIFLDKINITNFNIENNCDLNIVKANIILVLTIIIMYFIANFNFTKKDIIC